MLAVLLALAGAVWLFAELADLIDEGEPRSFDTRILLALRSASDPATRSAPDGSRSSAATSPRSAASACWCS